MKPPRMLRVPTAPDPLAIGTYALGQVLQNERATIRVAAIVTARLVAPDSGYLMSNEKHHASASTAPSDTSGWRSRNSLAATSVMAFRSPMVLGAAEA